MGTDYGALTDYLKAQSDAAVVELSFAQLDRIVGGLPASARKYAAWWPNTYTAQPHSHSWLDAGRRAVVDFSSGRVRFELGAPTTPRKRSTAAGSLTRAKRVSLTPTGEVELTALRFEWFDAGHVELDPSGKISSNPLPDQGGVYRFTLRGTEGELLGVYVGESDNLSRRMSNYRSPGPAQPTNIRLNERIVSILGDGGSVELHVVLNATVDEQALDMTIRPARLLVENAALVELARRGVKVENL